jgi:hypothetical protein
MVIEGEFASGLYKEKDFKSFFKGNVVDCAVYLGFQDLANSDILLLVFTRLDLLDVQALNQFTPLSLPITLAFFPVRLYFTDA